MADTFTNTIDFFSLESSQSFLPNYTADNLEPLKIVISGASNIIETQTKRTFKLRNFLDQGLGNNENFIILDKFPVKDIISVDINTQPEIFYTKRKSGIIELNYNLLNKDIYEVEYSAGYDVIPYDIQQAFIELLKYNYTRFLLNSYATKNVGNTSFEFEVPLSVRKVLDSYKSARYNI